MREFFHGWRRKAGIVTLVMASLMTAVWIRSLAWIEAGCCTFAGRQHQVNSIKGRIIWGAEKQTPYHVNVWAYCRINDKSEEIIKQTYEGKTTVSPQWRIDYWPFPIPLTLLSAYLILWKPRTKTKDQPNA